MARRILLAGVALAVLGGCSSSAPVADPVPTSAAVPPTTGERPLATLAEPVDPAAADDPYCDALASVDALDGVQQLAAGADPTVAAAAVDAADAAVAQLTLMAPEVVRADWATLAAAYGELYGAYRTSGYDFTAMMADPQAASALEQLGGTDLLDAGDRVEQHAEAACGVAVGLGRTDGPGAGAPEPAAADPTEVAEPDAAPLSDADAASIGALLLQQFHLDAATEQQICFGRAVSAPAVDTDSADAEGTDPLGRYRALAAGCGIDTSALP